MSKALDIAEMIRTRIITAPAGGELPTVLDLTALADEIVVDRQKNISAEINKSVVKAAGTAVTILWNGWTTLDADSARPRLANSYEIRVYSKPILAGDNLAADDVMESIIARLWRWIPWGDNPADAAEVRGGWLIPDRAFVIYDLDVTLPAWIRPGN